MEDRKDELLKKATKHLEALIELMEENLNTYLEMDKEHKKKHENRNPLFVAADSDNFIASITYKANKNNLYVEEITGVL